MHEHQLIRSLATLEPRRLRVSIAGTPGALIGAEELQAAQALSRSFTSTGLPLPLRVDVSGESLRPQAAAIRAAGLSFAEIELGLWHAVDWQAVPLVRPLRALADSGVRLVLEGFGCGRSGLDCLETLPIDKVELHYSLTLDHVIHPSETPALIKSTYALTQSLGLDLSAGAVHSPATLAILQSSGVSEYLDPAVLAT